MPIRPVRSKARSSVTGGDAKAESGIRPGGLNRDGRPGRSGEWMNSRAVKGGFKNGRGRTPLFSEKVRQALWEDHPHRFRRRRKTESSRGRRGESEVERKEKMEDIRREGKWTLRRKKS